MSHKLTSLCILGVLGIASASFATEEMNPFTGQSLKPIIKTEPKVETAKKQKTSVVIPTGLPNAMPMVLPPPGGVTGSIPNFSSMMPTPVVPAPIITTPTTPNPELRYEIEGMVNSQIIIKDTYNPSRIIYKTNHDALPNGCTIEYPTILCNNAAPIASMPTVPPKSMSVSNMKSMKKLRGKKAQSIPKTMPSQSSLIATNMTPVTHLNRPINAKPIHPKILSSEKQYIIKTEPTKLPADLLAKLKTVEAIGYHVPEIGMFRGSILNNTFYAFIPIELVPKATKYFGEHSQLQYNHDKSVIFLLDPKYLID